MKQNKLWAAAIIVGALILMSYAFAAQSAPWTDFIGRDRDLSMCDTAVRTLKMTIAHEEKLQGILDDPNQTMEVKTIIKAEQQGLWQLEADLKYWINDTCKEA